MAQILTFLRKPAAPRAAAPRWPGCSQDFSIEVMPRTAAKIEDFRAILPAGTRVYLAHIDGTDFAEMLATARRLADEGFAVMPHFPARGIADRAELDARIAAYADVGVRQALVLAGGIDRPRGAFAEAMQLLRDRPLRRAAASPTCMSPATPRATATSTPPAATPIAMAALRRKAAFQRETDAADGDRHPVLLRRRARSSPGPTACGPPASPCRSISASPARPSCRR